MENSTYRLHDKILVDVYLLKPNVCLFVCLFYLFIYFNSFLCFIDCMLLVIVIKVRGFMLSTDGIENMHPFIVFFILVCTRFNINGIYVFYLFI